MIGWFAAVDLTELGILLGAVFAAFGGIMGAFFAYMNKREQETAKERKADQRVFADALNLLGDKIQANTEQGERQIQVAIDQTNEIAKGNREAEKRNGHLAEITVQSRDQVITAFQDIQLQHVVKQTVDSSTVKDEHIEHKA